MKLETLFSIVTRFAGSRFSALPGDEPCIVNLMIPEVKILEHAMIQLEHSFISHRSGRFFAISRHRSAPILEKIAMNVDPAASGISSGFNGKQQNRQSPRVWN